MHGDIVTLLFKHEVLSLIPELGTYSPQAEFSLQSHWIWLPELKGFAYISDWQDQAAKS